MPDSNLQEYFTALNGDIALNAQALDMLKEHAYVERMIEILADYGETEECTPCHWQRSGFKVDAYSFDDDHSNLSLVVAKYFDEPDLKRARVAAGEVNTILKRCRKFFLESLKGRLSENIELSNPAHDLAELIYDCQKDIHSVKIIMITNGTTVERRAEPEIINEIEITGVVWNIERTCTFERTGEREQISVDFENEYGGSIQALKQGSADEMYTTYLTFIPGDVLADLYGNWKIRLLERNLRVFLSQRPGVNRGIRDTIRDEPAMFCAYNNGITVCAQDVELVNSTNGKVEISKVIDFQIVNGGQTTASLHHTREKFKADLGDVMIQMKLMVINEEMRPDDQPEGRLSDIVVPKIGRYSNTQNKIQMADLLANDPPHPELHAISQNLPAPDPTGGSVQSFWFYERARGGWEEIRRLQAKTLAQRKKFDQKYPKKQRFDKSKFGKAWNSYLRLPHITCLGAMKSFARFNVWLQERDEDWQEFFKKTVAVVLMWNEAEKIVRRHEFGGYRHAIVTYSLSWLHHLTESKIDLAKIWHEQKLEEALRDSISNLAIQVNIHIRDTELNVTEWCKKEDCWKSLQAISSPQLPDLDDALITSDTRRPIYDPTLRAEVENIKFCVSKGDSAWFSLSRWLKDRNFMQGRQRSQAFNMGKALKAKKEPSAVLAFACSKIWKDAETLGWSYDTDDSTK